MGFCWVEPLAFFLVLEGMNGFHGTMNEHFVRAGKGLIYGGLLGLPVWFICTTVIKAFRDAPSGTVLRLFQLPGMIILPLTFAYPSPTAFPRPTSVCSCAPCSRPIYVL